MVAGLEDLGAQSPLMRTQEGPGFPGHVSDPTDAAVLAAYLAQHGAANLKELAGERPVSATSSQFERDVNHVRGIRRKIGMARDGKDVTEYYAPRDDNW